MVCFCISGLAAVSQPDETEHASGAAVMLVGHEPSLSGIGALLVGAADFEALAKAEAARIVDGVLRWRFAWDAETPIPAISAPR